MGTRTILVSADQELARMLTPLSVRLTTVLVSGLEDALADPTALQPDVIVVDLRDGAGLPVPLQSYKRAHPSTPVVMIASALDAAVMLQAMRAGVNECVTAPFSSSDLEEAIDRVTARATTTTTTTAPGELYAFVGSTGGVGTTTMAVNVATALAQNTGDTLFIDLHVSDGAAADFFAVQPRFSVIDALENAGRLDEAVFGGLTVRSDMGVEVLASAGRQIVDPIDTTQVRAVLNFALRHYRYTVLDVPRSDAALLDALAEVRKIVLVTNQQLTSVKNGSRLLKMLRQRYGGDRLTVAVTRYDPNAEIDRADVERVLGMSVAHIVPNNYPVALQALNRGRPLLLDNHSSLAASYKRMARDLRGETDRPKRKGGFFRRLTGRRT